MKGDFTRMTFDPKKHYHGVLMQQGRVQLDADWNEQLDIEAHRVETETRDVIGACGTPIDQPGFTLVVDAAVLPAAEQTRLTKAKLLPLGPGDFLIGPGRYYVDGLLIENEDYVRYTQQPDYPGDDPTKPPSQPGLEIKPIAETGVYLAYLDVWLRHVTALDDDGIREKALGGPDTATRAKTIWQVKIKKQDSAAANCANVVTPGDDSTGRLSARSKPLDDKKDECDVPPGAGYRRLENQLYRVEIHAGGKETAATFKWSRDNAAMVTAWKSKNGNDLIVGSGGPDEVLGFAPNQWIELSDDTRELQGQAGTLVKLVTAVGQKLTIDPLTATGPVDLSFFPRNPKVRRWDTLAASGGVRQVNDKDTPDGFIRLEDGVEIKFEKGEYRTGDYWLIPARTATADVEWPKDQTGDPVPQPKHGIYHHTCPLGLLNFDATKKLTVKEDCRPFFPPLTDLTCLEYVSGDGQEAAPKETLPHDLIVGVANGNRPVQGAKIQWTVTGGGSLSISQTGTDAQGLMRAKWTLGDTGKQQVTAELVDSANQRIHLPVLFNAQFAQGGAAEPGIHVTGIEFINGPRLRNDTEVPVGLLANGLMITCDADLRQISVQSRPTGDGVGVSPTVYVTLDLPYPFNRADMDLWGSGIVAFQPVILASDVNSDDDAIFWGPNADTKTWLTGRLFQMMQELKRGRRILAHLTLKGNFIWENKDKNGRYLDGEVFGVEDFEPATGASFTEARLPSGDKRQGGDLEMWFWLVPSEQPRRVILLGNPDLAAFKPLSTTRKRGLASAVNLAVERPALRGVVPPEYELDMNAPFDVAAAQALSAKHKLQGLKFTAWNELALFDAGLMIAEMLMPLEITMNPLAVDDLLTKLQVAAAAGDAPDAVLVDAALADELRPLGYTFEIVTL